MLSLGRIGVADETYVNGVQVGSTGVIPRRDDILNYRTAWQTPRNYFVPGGILKDGENTITIRVFSHLICGMPDTLELAPERTWKKHGIFSEYPPVTLAHAAMFTANLILLIILMIIFINDRKRKEAPLILLILAGAIALHLVVLDLGPLASGLTTLKIAFAMYAIAYLLFTRLAELYFNRKIKYMGTVMAGYTAIFLLSLAITPTTESFVHYSGFLYCLFSLIYHIYVPAILVMTIINDPMRYWYLSIVTALTLMMDLYYLYCLVSLQLMNLPFHISQVPILFIVTIVIFAADYDNAIKENSSMAKALLGKTREIQKLQKLYTAATKGRFKEEPRESINDLIEYLNSNYFEPYDRRALAGRFNINEDYMCQVFKKKTGASISNYINTLRIDAAKKLLEDTDTRVIDIAFHVGFENLTYFHRLFKTMTGTTPADYREKKNCTG
jgi:AraC-like DNA-binding protein